VGQGFLDLRCIKVIYDAELGDRCWLVTEYIDEAAVPVIRDRRRSRLCHIGWGTGARASS